MYISDSLKETIYERNYTSLMLNPYYTIGYANIAVNLTTGLLPIIALSSLNYGIYVCLLKRRKQVIEIGLYIAISLAFIIPCSTYTTLCLTIICMQM